MVTTCVVPVAGIGSRWKPISTYYAKELLPFGDKFVIDLIIDEIITSGFKKIIVITNKKKILLNRYLFAKKKSLGDVELEIIFQSKPIGLAHAIAQSKNLIDESHFAIFVPDRPAFYKYPVLKRLKDVFENCNKSLGLISLAKYPDNNQLTYGKCDVEKQPSGELKIIRFDSANIQSNLHLTGRLILSRKFFKFAEQILQQKVTQEVNDTLVLQHALSQGELIWGFETKDFVFDTGNPQSYLEAYARLFQFRKRL